MKIAIIRLSAIGDLVFASCILPYLKQRYPESHITWIVKEEFVSVIYNFDGVDSVIALPKKILQIPRLLRSSSFDLALDLQGLLKTSIILKLLNAKRKIGLGSKEGGQFLITNTFPRGGVIESFASEYHFFGQKITEIKDTLPMPKYSYSNHTERDFFLKEQKLTEFVALCPFTTRAQKFWIWDYWEKLIDTLHQKYKFRVVVLGAKQDTFPIKNPHVVNACGRGNLSWSFSILAKAKAVVSVDTGLGHFALSQGVPGVMLFGSTLPYSKPPHPKASVLSRTLPCSPCKRNPTCDGMYHCMRMLEPELVAQKLESLW